MSIKIHFYLRKWETLRRSIIAEKADISSISLYRQLFEWAIELKESKEKAIKELYELYFAYFERLYIEDYKFDDVWYSVGYLIENDITRATNKSLQTIVVVCRDVLWEIVAFKSSRRCPITRADNLRALTDSSRQEVFFCCDTCLYTENLQGIPIDFKGSFLPITPAMAKRLQIPIGAP